MVLNSQYIIIANTDFIEVRLCYSKIISLQIFSTNPNPDNPSLSILLERILVVEFSQLPLNLHSIENIVFDLYEPNVFYAIGSKNQNFESSQVPTPTLVLDNNRLEKFFIESDSFSSKTISYLELSSDPDETVSQYQFSQNQEKVVILSDKNNLSTFNLYEIRNP